MKNIYFCDLSPEIKENFIGLDYTSRKYPLMIGQNSDVYFKSNKLLSKVFSRLDLDYLWDDLKKGLITKDEIMDLYRMCGCSLEIFIEIFCDEK